MAIFGPNSLLSKISQRSGQRPGPPARPAQPSVVRLRSEAVKAGDNRADVKFGALGDNKSRRVTRKQGEHRGSAVDGTAGAIRCGAPHSENGLDVDSSSVTYIHSRHELEAGRMSRGIPLPQSGRAQAAPQSPIGY